MENDREFPRNDYSSQKDVDHSPERPVRQNTLINRLNYAHFQDLPIIITFRHIKYSRIISLKAKPQPCKGRELVCTWEAGERQRLCRLGSYKFKDIKVLNGKNMTVFKPDDIYISEEGVILLLPENAWEVSDRKLKRFVCSGVKARMIQSAASFCGELLDFSAESLHLKVSAQPQQTLSWINPECPVMLILNHRDDVIYSEECKVYPHANERMENEFILEPARNHIKRFKNKDFRATREVLIPSPHAIFKHPLTRKITTIRIIDISGSGFSIEENSETASLLPGMIIPEMGIHFSAGFTARCMAQVVHRSPGHEPHGPSRWGVAILDMEIDEHSKLLSVLHHAKDENSFLCDAVDLDALWSFFFETGFIYAKKYEFIQANKEKIKTTYQRLYTESPKIFRHFIYQENGRILAHMSMIRFYEKSWMIHHHAADIHASSTAGFKVLNQVSRYINEAHSVLSVQMGCVFCYFRPENKFPRRIFGGVAENAKNPKRCSLDTFAYFHFSKHAIEAIPLEGSWHMTGMYPEDFDELGTFYEFASGGLMLKALELSREFMNPENWIGEYGRGGVLRVK
jgi:hypothetical protein